MKKNQLIKIPGEIISHGGKHKRSKLIYVGKVKCKDGYTRKSYKKK